MPRMKFTRRPSERAAAFGSAIASALALIVLIVFSLPSASDVETGVAQTTAQTVQTAQTARQE